MNALANIVVPLTEHDAHAMRSRFLDAFAEVERMVVRMGKMVAKQPNDGASLGQRIERARQAQAGPQFSKDNLKKAFDALDAVCALLPLRADIVHSTLRLAMVDAVATLIFSNSRTADTLCPTVRIIDAAEFKTLTTSVQAISAKLRAALTPPSPPRPTPGAAAGP